MAAASHSTVTAFIEDALREALARRHRIGRYEQVILKTYGKQGLLPGVDIDDTASMLDLMESSDDPAGRHARFPEPPVEASAQLTDVWQTRHALQRRWVPVDTLRMRVHPLFGIELRLCVSRMLKPKL